MMLPPDIDPASRCRLALPKREDLDESARAVFDQQATPNSQSIRGLRGPAGIQLHSPELAKRKRPVGRYLRFEAGFSGRVRETAILIAARCAHSQFEWAAHEGEALEAGVPRETIEAIKHGRPLTNLDPTDALIVTLGREIFVDRKVSSDTYARALETFGGRALVDLVALMGDYASTAALLCAFDMRLDEGVAPPLPPLEQG